MDIKQLECFVSVAKTLNFSQTARTEQGGSLGKIAFKSAISSLSEKCFEEKTLTNSF